MQEMANDFMLLNTSLKQEVIILILIGISIILAVILLTIIKKIKDKD